MSGIIWIIIVGFIAGIIARMLSPGPNNPSGFILTTVIGIAVDAAMLAEVAGDAAAGVSPHARAIVLPVGTQPSAQDRVLSQIAFGERLPHLALALGDPIRDEYPRSGTNTRQAPPRLPPVGAVGSAGQ